MPHVKIEIEADMQGNVQWQLNVEYYSRKDNNADCKSLISTIERLSELSAHLESIGDKAETRE